MARNWLDLRGENKEKGGVSVAKKLSKYLLLLVLMGQGVIYSPVVGANSANTFRSRLDDIAEKSKLERSSESKMESEPSSEVKSDSQSKMENESSNESKSESQSENESLSESESNSETQNDFENESQSESKSETTSQKELNPNMMESDMMTEVSPVDESEATAFQEGQRTNDFIKALGALEAMEQYQINYSITDSRTDERVAEGEIVGNQLSGDLMGKISYYFPESAPNQYDFEFISYRHFDLAYVKSFELLNSMAFFNQPHFKVDVHEQIAALQDTFIAIETTELNRVNLQRDPLSTLLMLPDLNRLSRVPVDNLYQINELYLLSLERLEIPEYLFRLSTNFGFDFHLGMDILPAAENENQIDWNVTSEQRFDVSEKDNSLNFKAAVDSELSDLMLAQLPEGTERDKQKFSRQMSLDNNVMLDKLTKVNMVYNAKTQTYRISLVGIVEQIEFNLFSDETAGLETTEYRLDYQIKPTEREIPKLDEIKKMTGAEADYILEEFLSPE